MATKSQVPSTPGEGEQSVEEQAALPEEGKEIPADQPVAAEQVEETIPLYPGRQMHKIPAVPKERPSREDWTPPGDAIKGMFPGDTNVYPDQDNPVRSP